jgi:thioredoxin reductase
MAVDTPARIAILGAGPIGLEAALYARFLGYEVVVLERGGVAENVRRWGHVTMFSPFGHNRSTLGLAALAAQDDAYRLPPDDALLSGEQWAQRYLIPLSQTDLLADHLRTGCTVLAVARRTVWKTELAVDGHRGQHGFRVLVESADGQQEEVTADVVIDTTGVYGTPGWMGAGGAPAIGETQCRAGIHYDIPDVLGRDRHCFEARHTLVVGSGHSAATTIVAIRHLTAAADSTRVTWVTRRAMGAGEAGPIAVLPHDPLAARAALATAANQCVGAAWMTHRPGTLVHTVATCPSSGGYRVGLRGDHGGELEVDGIVADVGYRPDVALLRELRVDLCPASEAPMRLAASCAAASLEGDLQPAVVAADSLLTAEPNFYVLGAKSYGRSPHFLVRQGLQQIRDLFSIIGDRADLDLYRGAASLLKRG